YGNDEGTPELLRLAGNCSELKMTAVELRGHTPGGIAVHVELPEDAPRMFVGDSVFPGGVGKTNSPEEFQQLLSDVTQRVFSLPDGRGCTPATVTAPPSAMRHHTSRSGPSAAGNPAKRAAGARPLA